MDHRDREAELEPEQFKACCADFYADDLVRRILGESFHPGGTALTEKLVDAVSVGPGDRVLDLAAGPGTSAVWVARERGCQVVALDLSPENLARARKLAEREGVAERVETRQADAESLPFADESFDVVLCECAFCTFPDKNVAAREMVRVLRPGGRLALSDMTILSERFPEDLNVLLMRVACIADALPEERLIEVLSDAGLAELVATDESWALEQMVKEIRKRLLAVELASKLSKLDLGGLDLAEGKRVASRSLEIIREGVVSYATVTGRLT